MSDLLDWLMRAPAHAPALLSVPGDTTGRAGPPSDVTYGQLRSALAGAARVLPPSSGVSGPLTVSGTTRIDRVLGMLLAAWAGREALILPDGSEDGAGSRVATVSPHSICWPEHYSNAVTGAAPARGHRGWRVATSGSTGPARIAILGPEAIAASVSASRRVLGFRRGDTWILALPPDRIGGLMVLARALACAGPIRILESFEPDEALRTQAGLAGSGNAAYLSVVPAMLEPLLDAAGPGATPTLLVGGAALPARLADELRRGRWNAWATYGMTETCSHVALQPIDSSWKPGLAGTPVPGARIEAHGSAASPSPIEISGPMLMRGYVGHAALDDRYTSGDLGFLDDLGRLHVTGRADAVMVSGGINVHPEAVEARIGQWPDVGDVAVGSLPDDRWGERIVAVYTGEVAPETLARRVRGELPAAWRPRECRRVAGIPRTPAGKLDRSALHRLLARTEARDVAPDPGLAEADPQVTPRPR